jgi:Ni,Fe-hydrogenase III small subunit
VAVDSGMIRASNHFPPATVNLMVIGKQNVSSLAAISGHTGIHFVTAAEKAHGLIFTEEITIDLEEQVSIAYEQMLPPKLIILAGAQAISSGVRDDRNKNLTGFMKKYPVDLYVPGNPFHPVSLTEAVKELIVLSQFRKK